MGKERQGQTLGVIFSEGSIQQIVNLKEYRKAGTNIRSPFWRGACLIESTKRRKEMH